MKIEKFIYAIRKFMYFKRIQKPHLFHCKFGYNFTFITLTNAGLAYLS